MACNIICLLFFSSLFVEIFLQYCDSVYPYRCDPQLLLILRVPVDALYILCYLQLKMNNQIINYTCFAG